MHKRFWRGSNGFTLFELLVTISIIGVLIAVGSVSYTAAQRSSRDARRKADLQAVQKAQEQYMAENNAYAVWSAGVCTGSIGTQMEEIPLDPRNDNEYYYYCEGNVSTYCVEVLMERGNGNCEGCQYNAGSGTYVFDTSTDDSFCVKNLQ